MQPGVLEHPFDCPYCGESISVLLDLSPVGEQDYIEDCEVCCRPIRLRVDAEDCELVSFYCERAD